MEGDDEDQQKVPRSGEASADEETPTPGAESTQADEEESEPVKPAPAVSTRVMTRRQQSLALKKKAVEETPPEEAPPRKRKRSVPEESDNGGPSPQPTTEAPVYATATDSSNYCDVAGVYAPLLRLRNKRELDEIPVVALPPRTVGGLRDQIEKSKQCNCRRSNCLKLYCECFASGIHCSAICNCVSCHNDGFNYPQERNESILVTLERNPHAFRPRIIAIAGAAASVAGSGALASSTSNGAAASSPNSRFSDILVSPGGAHSMTGCNCKKSFCLKKYCECFHAAVYCNPPHCRCTNCCNIEGNPKREQLVAKRRSQAEAAAAAAALAHQHTRLAHMSGRMAMMGDAGRTYYGAEHSNAGEGEVEAMSAAAVMGLSQAAGGIDVFLPPSSYAVPMQLENGKAYAALSFGTAGPRTMGQSAADSHQSSNYSTPSKQGAHRNNKKPRSQKRPRARRSLIAVGRDTELESAWKQEMKRVESTFQAIRQVVQERPEVSNSSEPNDNDSEVNDKNTFLTPTKETKSLSADTAEHEENERQIQDKARAMVTSVERDLKRLVEAWRMGKPWAEKFMDEAREDEKKPERKKSSPEQEAEKGEQQEKDSEELESEEAEQQDHVPGDQRDTTRRDADGLEKEEKQAEDDKVMHNSNSTTGGDTEEPPVGVTDGSALSEEELLCDEEMAPDPDQLPLSDHTIRELTILAAQDTALLRELAQSVRRKALEMARERIRYATEVTDSH